MFHSSHDPFYRVPAGPAPAGSEVLFRFRDGAACGVVLRTWMAGETLTPMQRKEDDVWETSIVIPDQTGLLWYDFIIYFPDGGSVRYGNAYDRMGGEGAVYHVGEVASYQLTVYRPDFRTPDFLKAANIYQIYPDRFFRAATRARDDRTDRVVHRSWKAPLLSETDHSRPDASTTEFYGGTLNGIRKKLGYLQELGITVLYLNPIFMAKSSNRYDTADYLRIDPLLGTQAEFETLCEEAQALGIRVLLDGVFSHTGSDSVYFNADRHFDSVGAAQGTDSPYYNWYSFDHFPDRYRCWWGFKNLPEVRKDEPSYRDMMFRDREGVVPRWLRAGASGWRLDVADELPMDFLTELRRAAKKAKRDAALIGEVWEDASNKLSYGQQRCYCTGDTVDSVMNYPLREAILQFMTGAIDADALVRLIRHQAEVYPAQFRYATMNLLGSHDRARALNVLIGKEGLGLSQDEREAISLTKDEYRLAVERFKKCVRIICGLPGAPTVYYGDEAGMTGTSDPFCRKPFPWGQEDTDLQSFVRDELNHRRHSQALRFGHCEVEALDADTIRIVRYLDGQDALGRKCASHAREERIIRR